MPRPRDEAEELAGEPWFYVPENQVFPEEFRTYLRLPRNLNAVFDRQHADVFDFRFWEQMQERLRAGEVIDIFPYGSSRRLSASRDGRGAGSGDRPAAPTA